MGLVPGGGRGIRVSWHMSPGRKGEWGRGPDESPFSPSQLRHSQAPPGNGLLSPQFVHGACFSVQKRVWGSDWPLAPALPPEAQLACPSTRSPGMETQILWGAGVGRGRSTSRQVTSPLDTPNTLEALRCWASRAQVVGLISQLSKANCNSERERDKWVHLWNTCAP